MAFIVEMFNGKPDRLEIMELDSNGELYLDRVIPDGPPNPDFRKFSCSGQNWEKALELGQKMGWTPMGSVLEKTIDTSQPIMSDYKPSSWGEDDYKIFSEKDAAAFADALQKAVELMEEFQLKEYGKDSSILIVEGMNKDEYSQINRNLSQDFLNDFISFLRKGKFKFVWDD